MRSTRLASTASIRWFLVVVGLVLCNACASSDGSPDAGGGRPDAGTSSDAGTRRFDSGTDAGESGPSDAGSDSSVVPEDDASVAEHCAEVDQVDPLWAEMENEVIMLVNEHRATGADCGSQGVIGPRKPLTLNTRLRCAARLLSKDMDERGFYDHFDPDGNGPVERMRAAGYVGFASGENISADEATAASVMEGWMQSDGHCANLMSYEFTEIGVGYWEGVDRYWTQDFGAKCFPGFCD
jgi:uncharacterized protein YkwD